MKKLQTRKKILASLKELVSLSKRTPIFEVDVHSQTNYREDYSALMEVFRGGSAKDDLLSFLMDKSLTHRIMNMRGWCCKTGDSQRMMEVHIYLLGSNDKFLEYTNIDSEMMELLRKVRFDCEDI